MNYRAKIFTKGIMPVTRLFCVLFALIICAGICLQLLAPAAQANDLNELNKQYDRLEKELEQIKNAYIDAEIRHANNETLLAQRQKETDALQAQLVVLEKQNSTLKEKIALSDEKVRQLDIQINSLKIEIDQNIKEQAKLEKEVEAAAQLLMDRMRANYMAGSATWLEVLMQSQNVQEYLMRMELFSRVVEHDQKLIEGLEEQSTKLVALVNDLQSNRQKLEDQQREATAARNQLYSQERELKQNIAKLNEKQNELDKSTQAIQNRMSELKKNSAAYVSQQERLAKELDALEAEIAKAMTDRPATPPSGAPTSQGEKLGFPIQKGANYAVGDRFGHRINPFTNVPGMHNGVDFKIAWGTPILAIGSGTVIISRYHTAYGYYIMIDHGSGMFSIYAHATKLLKSVGDHVKRGERIMLSGSTGWSTGPHLHFELHIRGSDGISRPVDPLKHIPLP